MLNKIYGILLVVLSLVSFSKTVFGHAVQIVYCSSCTGELVLWVEHWHGSESASSTQMTISLTINGVTTTSTGSPEINLQNTALNDLPGCAETPVFVASCSSEANTYNDWVRYTFPQAPCGVDISVTVSGGSNAFTANCGGLYPASTGTFQIQCPQPPVQLPDVEACANTMVPIITFPNSSAPGVDYEWTSNNPAIGLSPSGNGDIPAFQAPPSTQTEVSLIDVKQGCNNSQFNITIRPQPEPSFSVTNNTTLNPTGQPLTTCLYDSIYFQNQSIISAGSIQSVLWDFGEAGATSTAMSPAHLYSSDGTYNVTLTSTSDKGCVDDTTLPVVVYPVPKAILLSTPVCQYDSVQFEDSSQINFPDYIDQTITNFGDGSAFSSIRNPKHLYANDGSYNVSYITISNHGCIDDTSATAVVYDVPIANFTNTTVCENTDPTAFFNQSSVTNGSVVGWQWNFDEPVNAVSTLPNPLHDYSEDGVFNVRLVVNTERGCFDTIVHPVTVLAKPTTIFTSDITEDCSPACINFMDLSLSNATSITSWQWDLAGGDSSLLQNPSKCYSNTSNTTDSLFTIGLITGNDLGCYDTIQIEDYIASWHNPVADFEVNPELTNMYLSEIEFPNNSIGADFYDWNFGDDRFSVDFEPIHTYRDTGTYTIELIVETIHGCKDTTYRSVRIDPVVSLFVPNAFTPNGDGDNDVFIFKQYAIIEETVDFKIFDKWGALIYYTDGFNPWDGTYKGEPSKEDTYVYKIKCVDFFGNEHKKYGHVNLIR